VSLSRLLQSGDFRTVAARMLHGMARRGHPTDGNAAVLAELSSAPSADPPEPALPVPPRSNTGYGKIRLRMPPAWMLLGILIIAGLVGFQIDELTAAERDRGQDVNWSTDEVDGSAPSKEHSSELTPPRRATSHGRLPAILTQKQVNYIKLAVALAGTLLLLWGSLLHRTGRPNAHRRLRDGLLMALGLFAGLCWWNLLHFHFGTYVHTWDTYHYYMGAKYFPELAYTRLYMCASVADTEDGVRSAAEDPAIRDLETNTIVRVSTVLADPARCTAHFSDVRWAMFKHDNAWFRAQMSPSRWARAHLDHGYNGTPVWGILGSLLAHSGPASRAQVLTLALVDPLLLLLMWGFVAWAFGWRVMCVALLYWGTNFLAPFSWNGGGYLRQDWLALSIIGICLLRRERPGAAGFALATAALLRIFPALIVAGIALKALIGMWNGPTLRLAMPYRRFTLGCLAAVALLVPSASFVAGDWSAWSAFTENSRKHWHTPLTNYVGLKTVVTYAHDTRARFSAPLHLEDDPFQVWKESRRRLFAERRYLFLALLAAFTLLLARAARNHEDWVAATLGVGMIPIAADLTCYYYSILLAFGFLWGKREAIGSALCALAAVTGFLSTALGWSDEKFTAMSVAVIAFVAFATVSLAKGPSARSPERSGFPEQDRPRPAGSA